MWLTFKIENNFRLEIITNQERFIKSNSKGFKIRVYNTHKYNVTIIGGQLKYNENLNHKVGFNLKTLKIKVGLTNWRPHSTFFLKYISTK